LDSVKKEKLTLIELFSGIGAQKKGIDKTGLWDCEVIATSEIDKDAMLSYAAIHEGLTPELLSSYSYPLKEEMVKYLTDRNIGYNFLEDKAKDWGTVKLEDLKLYYLACVVSKNIGDVSKVEELPEVDFWTYSFPCTDISVMGLQQGIEQGKTRSGLLYEVMRLLEKAKESNTLPKYLLLENVKNFAKGKFKDKYKAWLSYLNDMGYENYGKVLNAKDTGIPQARERVFVLSIRKDISTGIFDFPSPIDSGLRIRDLIDDTETVPVKYIFDKGEELYDDFIKDANAKAKSEEEIIHNPEDYLIRLVMPKECFRFMGFDDEDYEKCKAMGVSDAAIYHQAGNSIATSCISVIMKRLYEAQHLGTYDIDAGEIHKHDTPNEIKLAGVLRDWNNASHFLVTRRVYNVDGIMPTLLADTSFTDAPKFLVKRKGK